MVGAFTTYPFAIEQEKNRLAVHALVVNAGGLAHAVVVKLYARERIFKERVQVYGVYGLYFFLRNDTRNHGNVFQRFLASRSGYHNFLQFGVGWNHLYLECRVPYSRYLQCTGCVPHAHNADCIELVGTEDNRKFAFTVCAHHYVCAFNL